MIAADKVATFAITFTAAFAVIYVICTELNLPLLTYHPVIGEIDWFWKPERRGPAMYWYGWMLSSLIAALVVAWLATMLPQAWLQRGIIFGCLVALGYLILNSLALFVYDKATVELEFLKSRSLSAAGAILCAVIISYFMPARWTGNVWAGWAWVVPVGALAVLAYYLSPYFTR
jgi:hypothetical protein